MGRKRRFTVDFVQENYGNKSGATVLRIEPYCTPSGAVLDKVYFICKCGAEASVTAQKFNDTKRGKPDGKRFGLYCKKCAYSGREPANRRFTYEYVKNYLEDNGVQILSTPEEIVDSTSYVRHTCKNCGRETRGSMTNIFYVNKGHKYTFLCNDCGKHKIPTIEMIEEVYFKPVGAKLLTKEYKNCFEPLEFECSCCGKKHHINYHNLSIGANRQLLCPECSGACQKRVLKDDLDSDSWEKVKQRRTDYDAYFLRNVKFFFNISDYDSCDYTYHHVKPFYSNHFYAMSITNILPVKRVYHKYGTDFYRKLHIPFKKPEMDVYSFSEYFKLPYMQDDSDLFNPADFLFVDVIIPEYVTDLAKTDDHYVDRVDATNSKSLLNVKKDYAEKGIVYLPFFYFEFVGKRPIIRSMFLIRGEKLRPGFSKLYGFSIDHIYARKCTVKKISSQEAMKFQDKTHIQGGVAAKYNYGLFYQDDLVGCMSFGVPRASASQKPGTWELYRLSFKLLTVVPGGASKLFKAFVEDVNPVCIESFCDIRFLNIVGVSDFSSLSSVYTNLGFEFAGVTNANYWYYDNKNVTFKNRRSYQKHLLKDKLAFYDPSLSEKENCKLNGLVPQYDCGNIKYVWKNPDFVDIKQEYSPGQVLSMFDD